MSKPRVLIGIPTVNRYDCLMRCLSSIAHHTPFGRFDVKILVASDSDRSEDIALSKSAVHQYRQVGGMELIYGQGRTGIAATWNRIVRTDTSKRDVVVLLNDDVEITDDWLDVLVYSVLENKQIVGAVSLNCYVSVTEAQVREHNGYKPPRLDYNEARLLDGGGSLLSTGGAAFAFRRENFDAVKGFDDRYFCFYEEIDFSVTLRRRFGLRAFMASYPVVYHMGGATNSLPENLDARAHMERSRKKFVEKWGEAPDAMRRRIIAENAQNKQSLYEWNTQLKFLKDE